MASTTSTVFLAISLVLLPIAVRSDLLSPLVAPIFDDVCKRVECGKGTCKASHNSTFFYECECDLGWKQTRFDEDDHLKFLPCIVPNCTMDYGCAAAPPSPVVDKSSNTNGSIFEPCHWMDCGGGSCNKTSTFTYSCECGVGYYNLLNISTFPCLRDCSIGLDCQNLGIAISNKSTTPSSVSSDNGSNEVSSNLRGKFYWWMILMVTLALLQWN
ncbi:adhesive plaque matrix protein 2 [Tripterygium wilfordii]|uniref:Adhesive plaque matrix protein 2 n=1 Tax=Tripterygium wilfordii TaxID=458696 RepID=A0A7J7E1J7_TRIWF|nr:uncharacterized protein LOC119988443 [Tripterygium wilfordii]KAF5752324.1 adhesive plaque matrix protein 2 [Tripterygium wilfordii]